MKTRRREYKTKPARLITQQRVDGDGILSFQPHVKVVRLESPRAPSKRKNAGRAKVRRVLIDANGNGTAPKYARIRTPKPGPKRPGTPKSRGHARIERRESEGNSDEENFVRPFSRQPPRNCLSPPIIVPQNKRKIKKSAQSDRPAKAFYHRNNDMVLYAIDLANKCYAIKIFPTPFEADEGTFDDYLSKSMNDAGLLCDRIARGSLSDIASHPQISECHDVSPLMMECITKRCRFELTIMTFHLREKRLRDLNMRIIEAMHDKQLLSCMNALDELYLAIGAWRHWLTPLIFKKQPRIVCTLLDLLRVVDESIPMWKSIQNCAARAIGEIKQIFDFNGKNKDFLDKFLLEMKLFKEMTAHMTDLEKYELVDDPVKRPHLEDEPVIL